MGDERQVLNLRWPGALGHPLAVGCLGGWLLNDHVWKDRFHNALTGKLSDVFGLVVFPLLLAALLERGVRRPMAWATAATVSLFVSINMSSTANGQVERIFGLWVADPILYPDPTDLLVLPAVAGAWFAWHRPLPSIGSARKAWGRTVLAGALVASIATSEAGQTVSQSSSFVLDSATPVATVEIVVRVDGELSTDFSFLQSSFTSLNTSELGPVGDAVSVDRVVVDGVVHYDFELINPDYAPVQVDWWFFAEYYDSEVDSFEYEINPPGQRELQAPVMVFENAFRPSNQSPRYERWAIKFGSADAMPVLLLSPFFNQDRGRVITRVGDTDLRLEPGVAAAVPVPNDCADGCEVELLISGSGEWRAHPAKASVGLYDENNLTRAARTAKGLIRTPVEVALPELPEMTEEQARWFRLNADVTAWEPGGPFEALVITVDYALLGGEQRAKDTIMVLPGQGESHFIPADCCHDGDDSIRVVKAELVSFDPSNELPKVVLSTTFEE